MKPTFDTKELKQFAKDIMKIDGGVKKVLKPIVDSIGEKLLTDVKNRVPKDTGNLKDNVKLTKHRTTNTRASATISVRKDAWYGNQVELGTGKMVAQPFLRPAVDDNESEYTKEMQDKIMKEIEKQW